MSETQSIVPHYSTQVPLNSEIIQKTCSGFAAGVVFKSRRRPDGLNAPTRPSLLIRLRQPRDERAWVEFTVIYTPRSEGSLARAACKTPTPPTWPRRSSAPSPAPWNAGLRSGPRLLPSLAVPHRAQPDH